MDCHLRLMRFHTDPFAPPLRASIRGLPFSGTVVSGTAVPIPRMQRICRSFNTRGVPKQDFPLSPFLIDSFSFEQDPIGRELGA